MAERKVFEHNRFKKAYKNLSHEGRQQCDGAVNMLLQADDPRSIAYERIGSAEYVYRFGNYRLSYNFTADDILELLELYDVGHGHNIY